MSGVLVFDAAEKSVGKSLTFEHTVREAMELQKNYKCKNPICETQLWKLRHELDMAQLNIQRLQRLTRFL
jgi:ionotropic glutamate receptor NMDA 2B